MRMLLFDALTGTLPMVAILCVTVYLFYLRQSTGVRRELDALVSENRHMQDELARLQSVVDHVTMAREEAVRERARVAERAPLQLPVLELREDRFDESRRELAVSEDARSSERPYRA